MAKFCSNCGKELKDNADICLNCGVLVNNSINKEKKENVSSPKKKGLPTWAIVLIVLGCILLIPIVVLIFIGIFAYNFVKEVPEIDVQDKINDVRDYLEDYMDDYENKEVEGIGTVGDTLEVDNIKFTLKKVENLSIVGRKNASDGNKYLVFFFDVENTNDDEKLVSYLNFNGYADEEQIAPELFFEEIDGIGNLNKNIKPEEIVSGYVAFEVPSDYLDFELHYKKIIGSSEIIFNITNEDNSL